MSLLVTCLVFALGVTFISAQGNCPPEWTATSDSDACIKLYSKTETWTAARDACKAEGGDLVKITDGNMNAFIWELISSSGASGPLWIGLNDRGQEGKYVWNDETTSATYTNWGANQPNNWFKYGQFDGQDCTEIAHPDLKASKWNDNFCSSKFGFICEKEPNVQFSTTALEERIEECCAASEEVEDNAKAIEELTATVSQLSEQVKELSGLQQTFNKHDQELEELAQLVADLSNRVNEEFQSNAEEFEEIKNELSNEAPDLGKEALVKVLSIDKNKYVLSSLYKTQIYIASKSNQQFDLENTNNECKANGGYLVEFDDEEEQSFVANFMKRAGSSAYYTGGNDVDKEGTFVYYNSKKPVVDVKWKKGEPNNARGKEDCMEIQQSGLNDQRCGRSVKYICEIPLF